MRLYRDRTWGTDGPGLWAFLSDIPDRSYMGGRRAAVRLTLDQTSGLLINVAIAGLGSLVIGWMPDHSRCDWLADHSEVHQCRPAWLPDVHLGPDPKKLRPVR